MREMVLNIDTSKLQDGDKVQCPRCAANGNDNSKDNFHWYNEQQGGYCWACKFTIPSKEYVDLGKKGGADATTILQKDIDSLANKSLTQEQINTIHKNTVESISVKYRGLNSEVCKRLGVRWEVDKDGKVEAMYFPVIIRDNGEDKLVGYKVRRIPKEFFTLGYVGKLAGFFNKKDSVAKKLIIVSGEIDLITAIFALENSDKYRKDYNIVSPTTGEGSIANTIKLNYDWVDAHEQIIICTDMDDAGDESFEAVKAVVDNSKLFRAKLRHKDLNDYLKNGDGDKIANDLYWSPQPCVDYGIVGSGDLLDGIMDFVSIERIPLPPFLDGLKDTIVGGIPLGEVVNLISSVSSGKSVFVNEIVLHWIHRCPHKMLIISMEDGGSSYATKMMSRVTGVKILALETVKERQEAVKKAMPEFVNEMIHEDGSHRFEFLDKVPKSIEGLKEAILYAVKIKGVRVVLIDPIQSVLGSSSLEEQADFMNFQEYCRRNLDVTFLNVCHTRKSSQGAKAHSEGGRITEEDTKGSSQIAATATISIILMRNKMSSDEIERNTTIVDVPKNRTVGSTGQDVAKIYYSPQHHTLFDFDYAQKHNFFKGMDSEQVKGIMSNKGLSVTPDVIDNVDEVDESMDVF